ncbi:MAG: ATP-binding protein [Phycisphaerales bacterium]|jgi:signal transduction histidine kinase|nr:ATP-binding protein [Phycisphaerales bacterium]
MARQPPLRSRSVETPVADALSIDDRFAQLSAQFDVLKAQVRQAQQLSSLGTAAAMIAHEVNNLLTPILSYADYALATDDAPLAKKALTVTARNTRMLIAMSERILELGAAKPQRRESVGVRQAVEEALASLCRDLFKDGITFEMKVDETLTVFADPLQLRQVLFNLFLNAREAMAPNHSGRLTVSAYQSRDRKGAGGGEVRSEKLEERSTTASIDNRSRPTASGTIDKVVIEIRNTGPPIPPELLPHIFEPFQTTKPVRRDGKSRCGGLGLALVRDLIEENDGTISVASDETGTTFAITLPPTPV